MADMDKEISEACENNNELGGFKVSDLKKYLADRRLNVSGRKCELILRIKGAHKLSIVDKKSLIAADIRQRAEAEKKRFVLPSREEISPPEKLAGWTKEYDIIPDVTEKDIYNYIVLKKNSKRQLKSKGFYEARHVHNIEVNQIAEPSSHFYTRASVIPSFPTADKKKSPDYHPWVLLSKVTGCVHSAYCNCTAGEGECCNHIGALLYAIADLGEKRSEGTLASTSNPCTWSKFSMAPRKRKLSPCRSQDATYSKVKTLPSIRKLSIDKDHELNKINGCTVNIDRFKTRLMDKKLNVGWLKNFPDDRPEAETVPLIHSVEFMYCDNVNLASNECETVFNKHFKSLNMSKEDAQLIEIQTRGQSGTEWTSARQERLTSSNFGTVCRRKKDTQPDSLLKDMLYSKFRSKHTDYGKKHEKPARKMYVKKMQTTHKGISVKMSGLIVNPDQPYLGTSPDGLVYCTHCDVSTGLLEIKCPSSMRWRLKKPEECCRDKDFFCYLEDGSVKLKRNNRYYYQVQGQMGVSGRTWCDFVVWTCAGLSVERIDFDEDMWRDMSKALEAFYISAFIPELYSRRVERGIPLFP